MKIRKGEHDAQILVCDASNADRHNHLRDRGSPQLSREQTQAARKQAKMNPLNTVNEMRRNLDRCANEVEKIPFDKLRNIKWCREETER